MNDHHHGHGYGYGGAAAVVIVIIIIVIVVALFAGFSSGSTLVVANGAADEDAVAVNADDLRAVCRSLH